MHTTRNPKELELFNKLNEMQQVILKQELKQYKKSFAYQVAEYQGRLIKNFEEFEKKKGKYIDLKGEVYPRYLAGELDDLSRRIEDLEIPTFSKEFGLIKSTIQAKQNIALYDPIDSYITRWLSRSSARFLAILGEYGTGKTTLCTHIASQLAQQKETCSIQDERCRIPLLFVLRNFKNEDMEDFIVSQLNRNGIEDINYSRFVERLENGEFVILFDGFDEMAAKIDESGKRRNFDKIQRLIEESPNTKVILTSREEYFRTQEEQDSVFREIDKEVIHLKTFDDEQILAFLESRTDKSRAYRYWKRIQETFDLKDLAKRAVLLELIIKHLPTLLKDKGPDSPILASDLYKVAIEEEVYRKGGDIKVEFIPQPERMYILQKVAIWMFINDSLIIPIQEIREELNQTPFFTNKSGYVIEEELTDFLSFSSLLTEGDYRYRISHKSFRDYLASTVLIDEINHDNIIHFGRKRISDEINTFILEQKPNQQHLLSLIKTSKNLQIDHEWQGSNATTLILELDKKALKGQNLSGCYLPEVNFLDLDLDLSGTDFTKTNLSRCLFNAKLLDAKYESAIMEDAACYFGDRLPQKGELEKLRYLPGAQISYPPPLSTLGKLGTLYLDFIKINEIQPLHTFTQLKKLSFCQTQVSDLSALSRHTQLTSLKLNQTQVSDLSPLSELTLLNSLNLDQTQVSDLSPLSRMTQLKELRLGHTRVSNLSALSRMTKLKELGLGNNKVSDVSALSGLTQLTKLWLLKNRVSKDQIDALTQVISGLEIRELIH